MNYSATGASNLRTPALVLSETSLANALKIALQATQSPHLHLLYTLKPLSLMPVLSLIASNSIGFSVCSTAEAKLARTVGSGDVGIYYSSPGLTLSDIGELERLCNSVSFNSISHFNLYSGFLRDSSLSGLRVNPQMSLVKDSRYDPCRPNSKLGVPLDVFVQELQRNSVSFRPLSGLHFHSNCDSEDLTGISLTVEHLEQTLGNFFEQLTWLNVGGGYIVNEDTDTRPLQDTADRLYSKYGMTMYFEPGASLVRSAGFIVSSVIDLFESDGKQIAVLDTTVNHMPEVFEYQFEPDIAEHCDDGDNEYILAGCSCLAGDIFGTYSFKLPLKIGQRLTFMNMGAYTLVKANMFNGIPLPTIYMLNADNSLTLIKEFGYEDYLSMNGAAVHESA